MEDGQYCGNNFLHQRVSEVADVNKERFLKTRPNFVADLGNNISPKLTYLLSEPIYRLHDILIRKTEGTY